ncbi:set-domain histone methyltransferase-6 [Trichoderma gamsii]|uniref:Set-domain histone methyltransferase-6 n=1 Tax=Trichoderma gamsii TaxID=398673 RepID=A0A2P4ZYG1_9HYPO|nr:set-domain histone methyltransferase-6 [Trichoderma gamsii]PON29320.1 set-domain histone methyltransferase-6 [Trichoderma gamsii]
MEEASVSDEAAAQVGSESLYAIQPIPGKGLGLIATKDIPKGTRILSELPLFKVSPGESNRQILTDHITKALKDLDKEKQRAFLDLPNVYGLDDGPFLGITRSNAMPLGPDAPQAGLFLDAARINHSCRPNAHKSWNANIVRLTVHALCDIKQGQEITISYLEITKIYVVRQALLKRLLFDCKCELCSAPRHRRQQSDGRIHAVEMVEMGLHMYFSESLSYLPAHDYAGGLTYALGMFTELKAEGARDARFPGVYHTAFKISVKNGDKTRAKIFAERAYAARVVVEGDDSPLAVELAQFVEEPTRHPLYRPSADGKEVELPRELSASQFEKWLWKQRPDVGEEEDEDEIEESESEDEDDDDL